MNILKYFKPQQKYFKITNYNETRHGYVYKDGLNNPPHEVYFTTQENIDRI